MPAKKKGDKKKKVKKPKKVAGTNETADFIVKRLMKCYEKNCAESNSQMSPGVKATLKDNWNKAQLMVKFALHHVPVEKEGDLPVLVEPLIAAFRQERYTYIKDLHLWDFALTHIEVATIALLLEKLIYPIRTLELTDCLLQPYPVERLSRSFKFCESLTNIILDYNEFGDEGCVALCKGLEGSTLILTLSLNYCDLGQESGHVLGNILSTTAIRELFVDGNDLGCEGAMDLIKLCADQAEMESFQRAEDARLKAEEEAQKLEQEKENRYSSHARTTESSQPEDSSEKDKKTDKKKKKKGKKKKKEKVPPPPPPVGPWIHKLHIADNGIDSNSRSGNSSPIMCMRLFKKLATHSMCLQELDLEDNLIGDLGGRDLLDSLKEREEAKLPGVKIRTTHRMNSETFEALVKMGGGMKKKKKKKGKKKKKK